MEYKKEYERWLAEPRVDKETRSRLAEMGESEIEDAFYRELEFGTGGLRGEMGPGTNRMNIYTVRKATQGLASYIADLGKAAAECGVVIAYDSRNNSELFAKECARVLSANSVKVYLFDSLRPTPELSFAVRYLSCTAGIVITASHNPKEYNGYKVYQDDGGQVAPEAASRILERIRTVDIFDGVNLTDEPKVTVIGEELDSAYLNAVKAESLGTAIPEDFSVLYTPLHGAGYLAVSRILTEIGIKNLTVLEAQRLPDGDFPTVKSPNPENREAFDLAIEYAKEHPVDLIFATDPDSDRLGVVVPEKNGEYTVLSGNQTGAILLEYVLRSIAKKGMPPHPRAVKTIVTTELVRRIADKYGVRTVDVLTGFKYIGDKIKEFECSGESYLFGLEESYGYLKGTYARDKDAVVAAMLVCEVAAECRSEGITLSERLEKIYREFGYHKEKLLNFTFKGSRGVGKIKEIMDTFRNHPPFDGELSRYDYSAGINGLPPSNVMKYILTDGWFAARPSGTEPKIKFYLAAHGDSNSACDEVLKRLESEITALVM